MLERERRGIAREREEGLLERERERERLFVSSNLKNVTGNSKMVPSEVLDNEMS